MSESPPNASPTTRFSPRVNHYVKARPGYPPALLDFLRYELCLVPPVSVADVGSGTGLLTRSLVEAGYVVHAVEPNAEMRHAAEQALRASPRFHSVAAPAEATTLPAQSIRLITVAQAFHWFDVFEARREFQRILAPGGVVALIWNDRRTRGTPFAEEYDAFLYAHATDLTGIANRWRVSTTPELLAQFFGHADHQVRRFENHQSHDYPGLESRVLSSSYMPLSDSPAFPPMIASLRELFARHEQGGTVVMEYETVVYWSALS